MDGRNNTITKDEIYKKYIKRYKTPFYDIDNLIQKYNIEDLICPICFLLLKNPVSCSNNKNSHSFCKKCIDLYLEQNDNDKCPICKQIFKSKIKISLIKSLYELSFYCSFKKEGCNEIISYSEYFRHINNCKYNNIFECQIKKYNYETKAFEICGCGIKNNKRNIENHFKLCAFIKYKCIFCIENIAQKDLEEHVKNKCRLRIIYYPNGNKYFGEMKNNIKDGYGTLYYKNGEIYEGEWKNDVREGYGIFYSPLGLVEGEWKNNDLEGFGIKYYEEGRYEGEYKKSYEIGYGIKYDINDKILYEGEFNHSKYNGYGVEYLMHSKYEGEFVNNKKEGYGTLYNDYFGRFEGEFKDDFMEGYGSAFYINGDKYKGYFKNGIEGGYGIMFFSDGYKLEINYDNKSVIGFGMLYNSNNKLIYKGEYQGKYFQHGYGIFYYECGCIYEGEFKKDLIEGYGVLYSEKGYIYEGEYKDGRLQGYGIIYNKNKEIIYKGQFKEDLKEGYGKLYNSNGYRYEGEWKNDLEDGFGILYYPNGNRYEGKFKVHSINGIRKLYSPLGIEYTKDT